MANQQKPCDEVIDLTKDTPASAAPAVRASAPASIINVDSLRDLDVALSNKKGASSSASRTARELFGDGNSAGPSRRPIKKERPDPALKPKPIIRKLSLAAQRALEAKTKKINHYKLSKRYWCEP